MPRAAGNVVGRRRSERKVRGGGRDQHAAAHATRSRQRWAAGMRSARAFASASAGRDGRQHRGSLPRQQSSKKMFCGSCGEAYPPGSATKFCMECGAPRQGPPPPAHGSSSSSPAAAEEPRRTDPRKDSHATYMQRLQDEEAAGWGDLSRHADAERERMQQLVAERRSKGASRRNQKKKKKKNRRKKKDKKRTSVIPEEGGDGGGGGTKQRGKYNMFMEGETGQQDGDGYMVI